jgi:type IV pilus assembly protein PilM
MAFGLSSLTSLLKTDISKTPAKTGVLGIDIGSSAIKIVQLRNEKGVPTLETYGELQLGPYEGVDLGRSTHLPAQKITEALIDILREAGATGKDVAFALSYNSSFTTTIPIPTLEQERIGAMVPIEARKYIPISLTKVTLDWFPLSVHKEEKITHVLITAIYNEALSRYESIMQGGGLTTVASEIEIFSSIRSILSPKDDVVGILDFGASSTRLYVVKKGVVGKTHSVLLSGVELTHALEEALSIEFKAAEDLKRNRGLQMEEGASSAQRTLLNVLERGLRELHTVITRYEQEEGVAVSKIILSGSGSMLSGLGTYTQDMFSKTAVFADPFSKVAYPAFLEDTLKVAGPSFAVAVGVALHAFQKIQ